MNNSEIDGPRACRTDELHEMIALVDSVMREGSDQTFLTDYPLVYMDSNLQNIFIVKVNGEMASVVPYFPREVVCEVESGFLSRNVQSLPNCSSAGS